MHGKFTRATERPRGMHGSVANAPQGRREETLALARPYSIIRETQRGPWGAALQGYP